MHVPPTSSRNAVHALRVLLCLRDSRTAEEVEASLGSRGHRVMRIASLEALFPLLGDVLVSDFDPSAETDLVELPRATPSLPTVFVCSSPSFETCRLALRMGAADVLDSADPLEIARAVEAAAPLADRLGARTYRRSYLASDGAVERAALDLAAYALRCGVPPAARARLAGAVAELVENAARHAYSGPPGPVRVSATLDDRRMRVVVEDDGRGFDPAAQRTEGRRAESPGGLTRVAALAESLELSAAPGAGCSVALSFAVSPVAFDDEGPIDLSELDFLSPHLARRLLERLASPRDRDGFHLSPALAVVVGRLLAGPDPRRVLEAALFG